jgi:hypothetical protein
MPRQVVVAARYVTMLPSCSAGVDELPFEFCALELTLEANYSLLDTQVISRTRKLTLANLLPQLFLQIERT